MSSHIHVSAFQPFRTRRGIDTVLALRFAYDPDLIDELKDALRLARNRAGAGNVGGWLADRKCWFVERFAFPTVRAALEAAGHVFRIERETKIDEEHQEPPPNPGGSRSRPPADMSAIVSRWYREMALKYHPDRGGTHEAMKAINHAAERLRELVRES